MAYVSGVADRPAWNFPMARAENDGGPMERRQFLQATLLGATATILGVVPRAVATTHLSFPQENAMSDALHPYDPLTSENAALVLIDHQVGLMTGVRDYSTGELKHNVVALAKAATALRLPIIVTTTARDSMWGPTFPELVEALPGVPIIDRSSVNAFDDAKVAQAITATGRKKLIFAGISLEVCAALPAITAAGKGLDAYVAVDASGTFSQTKRQVGLLRMLQAGVIVSDYATLMVEILKDNARPEAGAVYGAIDMPWAKLVGQIAHSYSK
jgi:nicotinamidase-related amidase